MKPTVKSEIILYKLQTHPLRVRFYVVKENMEKGNIKMIYAFKKACHLKKFTL